MIKNKFHYFIISLLIFPLIFIGCGGGGGSAGGGGSGGDDDVLDLTQLGDADLLELAQAEGTSPISLSYNIETVTPSVHSPEPATILLIGSGLLGLGLGLRHRKNKK